jgi:hypothetical protein
LANRHLNSTLVGDLTGKVMKAGRALIDEQPVIPHGWRRPALACRPLTAQPMPAIGVKDEGGQL